MAGFFVVLLMFGFFIIGVSIELFIPLIVGFITIPKGTNKKIKTLILYVVSIWGVQFITLIILIILAIPYLAFVQHYGYKNLFPQLLFNIIPTLLLIFFSIHFHKRVSKIDTNKKTVILITIQSFLLSFGLTFVALTISDTWLI